MAKSSNGLIVATNNCNHNIVRIILGYYIIVFLGKNCVYYVI